MPELAATLYRATLGAELDRLAPALVRFHGDPAGGRARGRLRVVRGRGLARLAGWVIGAPAAGDAVPVDMRVEVLAAGERPRERWVRSFAGAPMVTRQWRTAGALVEALGPSALEFELVREGAAMRYVQTGARLLGIPLPRWLSPRVRALAGPCEGRDDAWTIEVDIAAPVLGTIVGYSGIMELEP